MLVTPPFGASSNIALWRAYSKPPVELVVADLGGTGFMSEKETACLRDITETDIMEYMQVEHPHNERNSGR